MAGAGWVEVGPVLELAGKIQEYPSLLSGRFARQGAKGCSRRCDLGQPNTDHSLLLTPRKIQLWEAVEGRKKGREPFMGWPLERRQLAPGPV
jgi:hypothetical protein